MIDPTLEQFREFAIRVRTLDLAFESVLAQWREFLPENRYTPETGYPFSEALEDIASKVQAWADACAEDAAVLADGGSVG